MIGTLKLLYQRSTALFRPPFEPSPWYLDYLYGNQEFPGYHGYRGTLTTYMVILGPPQVFLNIKTHPEITE